MTCIHDYDKQCYKDCPGCINATEVNVCEECGETAMKTYVYNNKRYCPDCLIEAAGAEFQEDFIREHIEEFTKYVIDNI